MIEAGYIYDLKINRETNSGLFLSDEDGEEVLLPFKFAPKSFQVEDTIRVFIYTDTENRPIATTQLPILQAGLFGYLEAKDVGPIGAFMDIGTDKDLLVPYREQKYEIKKGKKYVVYMSTDAISGRLVGSTHINKFLDNSNVGFSINDEVDILIYEETDLGFNAIINHEHKGLLYKNEVFSKVNIGDECKAYIKQIREDNKIDLSLKKQGYVHVNSSAETIMNVLIEQGGFLDLHDKSQPEEIYKYLQMSKKTFKKAVGLLYKEKLIDIETNGIRLISKNN